MREVLVIRAYRAGDEAGIDALVDDASDPLFVAQAHPLHGPDRDGDRWRRTRVAVGPDGGIVGAVSLVRNRLHSQRYLVVVEVGRTSRRQGVGRALVEEALRIRPEPLPLMAKVLEADPAGTALLGALGGRPFLRVPSPRLSPDAMLAWCADRPVPAGAVLGPLDTVAPAELADAWVEMYVWVHEVFAPVTSRDALAGIAAGIPGEALPASTGAWVGGRLAAVAVALPSPWGGVGLVTETIRRDEPDGAALVAAVLAGTLRRLFAEGVTEVLLDGHETDPHLAPVIATFPAAVPATPLHLVEIDAPRREPGTRASRDA